MRSGGKGSITPKLGRPPTTSIEDILDAAERVGLDNLTRAAVARELGVSDATIRHHVESIDRLYARASARVFGRLQLDAPEAQTWQEYLRVLADRFTALLKEFPGVEDYVLRGPYERITVDMFEAIIDELMQRDTRLDRKASHLLGSRLLTLTAALRPPRRNRYPGAVYPRSDLYEGQVGWTIEAFLVGADMLIANGQLPEAVPTPNAEWTHLDAADPSRH
ncbi:TetR/AcrR family transcriptional regulator [Rhodococcus artemisiae]|uniref:TetR/AcrR family transcriptional regulator n=1 Tax=Rhodococcus artemisiae TaxID=714159 RepID=A0ABU7L3D1_9NOCA|nr:TetR/AcrR family transcriptional regulator [Rhodococcus artemisiae]MEE2056046.1 TetR/AcrR family transcriptional regulator [Rhodococcus artemisiae]